MSNTNFDKYKNYITNIRAALTEIRESFETNDTRKPNFKLLSTEQIDGMDLRNETDQEEFFYKSLPFLLNQKISMANIVSALELDQEETNLDKRLLSGLKMIKHNFEVAKLWKDFNKDNRIKNYYYAKQHLKWLNTYIKNIEVMLEGATLDELISIVETKTTLSSYERTPYPQTYEQQNNKSW